MQTLKATIQYIDCFGRIFAITEGNQAILIYNPPINGHKKGDIVTIERESWHKRMADWKIIEEAHQ